MDEVPGTIDDDHEFTTLLSRIPWGWRRFGCSFLSFCFVTNVLVTFFYPVWKVLIGGHIGLEFPGFDPIWKADRDHTVYGILGVELGIALLAAILVFAGYEALDPRRQNAGGRLRRDFL